MLCSAMADHSRLILLAVLASAAVASMEMLSGIEEFVPDGLGSVPDNSTVWCIPHELVHDVELLIPQHELDHRVGRHRPTERFRFALVVFDQARDLVRVEHLHRRALELLDFNLLLLSHSFFSLIASGESWAQVIHLENSYALASLSTSFLA